jgi:spermidine dehydrogenase
MKPKITRKDFLNGAAFTVASALLRPLHGFAAPVSGPDPTAREYYFAKGIRQNDPRYYPPGLTGMRGSHPGSFETAHALRDGKRWDATNVSDTGEHYDLIVVGGGISGLSAAHFFRQLHGSAAKILVLDNHDDFGGHAKRNEFRSGSVIGYGGTQDIEGWPDWSPQAKGLLSDLHIDPERFEKVYYEHDFRKSHGLKHAVFFDKETFGSDAMVSDVGLPSWAAFAARTPLSARAREDLVRFQTQEVDYLPGIAREDKAQRLMKVSFETFLKDHVKVDPQVVDFFRTFATGLAGAQIDAIPTLLALTSSDPLTAYWDGQQGPTHAALAGMGLSGLPEIDGVPQGQKRFAYYHFPDGNASIARMLVRSLIPGSAPGNTMEDIVKAKMDYTRLDQSGSNTRIRLNSTVVQVQHLGDPSRAREVQVTYVLDGKAYKTRASACVLACYNMIIPHLCPELPQKQKEALGMGVKAPLVYANAQLRNWQALQNLGVAMVYCAGSYFSEVYMDFPVSMGAYHYTQKPDQPVVLHMVRVPCKAGLPPRQQRRLGQMELYTTPFETFEHHIRDQLRRMLGAGGFDPNRDIEAITVNRWPHGYADFFQDIDDPDWPQDQRPNVIGRQCFGRISIANSDAAASAQTQAAIDEAYRAVQEVTQRLASSPPPQ